MWHTDIYTEQAAPHDHETQNETLQKKHPHSKAYISFLLLDYSVDLHEKRNLAPTFFASHECEKNEERSWKG